jgi:hypothetical protein
MGEARTAKKLFLFLLLTSTVRYSWNIAESGAKHHNTNPNPNHRTNYMYAYVVFVRSTEVDWYDHNPLLYVKSSMDMFDTSAMFLFIICFFLYCIDHFSTVLSPHSKSNNNFRSQSDWNITKDFT